MGQRGNNTRKAQRRVNVRHSREKLETLLTANFREGGWLITLTYDEGRKAPSRKLAELQMQAWLRSARDKKGQRMPYIRATAWEKVGLCPVQRVVVALPVGVVASLADQWKYGPVKIEPVQGDKLGALADLLMRPELDAGQTLIPCCRTWTPSKGLIRPGKGGKKYEIPNTHSRRIRSGREIL